MSRGLILRDDGLACTRGGDKRRANGGHRLDPSRPIVTRPYYDMAPLRAANEALLGAVIDRLEAQGFQTPVRTQSDPPAWSRLLLGQVCGYRYARRLSHLVKPLVAPVYVAEGVQGAFARAAVLVRLDDTAGGVADLQGRRFALSSSDFNSANLLRSEVAPLAGGGNFFAEISSLDGFAAPAQAVADGSADAALIDAVALGHLRRLFPSLAAQLRILVWTARSPVAPFVCSSEFEAETVEALTRALLEVGEDPALAETRAELLIGRFVRIEAAQYKAVLHHQQIARSLRYPVLA